MLVVVLLLPLSSSMHNSEFDHGCDGGGGGGLVTAVMAVVVAVAAVEDNYCRWKTIIGKSIWQ